jgi:hypothetical protein
MVRMSPRALHTIRRSTERWMVDQIELWSSSKSEFDDETMRETHIPGVKKGESKARISPTTGPREQPIGDSVIALRDADILLPIDFVEPSRDDEVLVVSSADPALVGRWFMVTDVRVFSQQAARRISVVQAQRSRNWDPDRPQDPEPEDPIDG